MRLAQRKVLHALYDPILEVEEAAATIFDIVDVSDEVSSTVELLRENALIFSKLVQVFAREGLDLVFGEVARQRTPKLLDHLIREHARLESVFVDADSVLSEVEHRPTARGGCAPHHQSDIIEALCANHVNRLDHNLEVSGGLTPDVKVCRQHARPQRLHGQRLDRYGLGLGVDRRRRGCGGCFLAPREVRRLAEALKPTVHERVPLAAGRTLSRYLLTVVQKISVLSAKPVVTRRHPSFEVGRLGQYVSDFRVQHRRRLCELSRPVVRRDVYFLTLYKPDASIVCPKVRVPNTRSVDLTAGACRLVEGNLDAVDFNEDLRA